MQRIDCDHSDHRVIVRQRVEERLSGDGTSGFTSAMQFCGSRITAKAIMRAQFGK